MTGQGSERWRVASLGGPSCGSSRPAVPRPDAKPSIQDPLTMLGIHDYWLFVATGVLLNLTPGQDTLYILGRSIAQGRRIGVGPPLGLSPRPGGPPLPPPPAILRARDRERTNLESHHLGISVSPFF